ncbi:phosphate ABC transporter substrate-binding protein [Paenibacillus cymbidii]|uniref:phosphate ABC transporter substrate-binding protein n=1 Tax=Paenibacillus cymbidii TaxID=1639034 RepID=UPI00108052DE|nr:phosphate ABC transporter substrate-binding protein [Paenibacillus cymbidii]
MSKFVWKKGLSLTLAAVLMVGGLAACGKKEEDTKNAASPSASSSVKPSTSTAPSASPSTSPSKAPEVTGKVTASGSTALQPLVQKAAGDFMAKNPKADIQVTGGGSGKGVTDVATGASDIGNSDVEADAQYKSQLVDHIVVLAPFALIVNKGVGVDNLTKQQAADIFMGKITNWKDVGGKDAKITVVHRPESSGSRKLVKQIVLSNQEFTKDGVQQDTSKAVAEAVGSTDNSIGYVDVPYIKQYADKIKALKLDGTEYSSENIKSGKYLLFGQEHMYTKGEATGATKAFLDYIMSAEFLNKPEVVDLGFLPADLLKK